MLRLDFATCVDFGGDARSGDAGIDGGFALSIDFRFLAEENDAESFASIHNCICLLNRLNVCSIVLLRCKQMTYSDISRNRDQKSQGPKTGHELGVKTFHRMSPFCRVQKEKSLTYR